MCQFVVLLVALVDGAALTVRAVTVETRAARDRASMSASSSTSTIYDVTTFGAKGDNATLDTAAFVAAIAAVEKAGGGTVLVPPPGIYLIAPINLTSNIDFHIADGARIVGVMNSKLWPIIPGAPSYGQGRNHGAHSPRFTSLLHGEHLVNVTIRGDGPGSVLDGQGRYWWSLCGRGLPGWNQTRGHLLEMMWVDGLVVRDLTMLDSPFWNNHIFACNHVHVTRVDVVAPNESPNTDGWDPDSSTNVLIEDSTYSGGDDCVAIKSGWDCFGVEFGKPSQHVHIRNMTCNGRFAGIAIGSEASGGVEDVLVENVRFTLANGAAHIKTGVSRGGYIKDVVFRDISIEGPVQNGILVDSNYGSRNPSCPAGWKPPALSVMSNYSFVNWDGRAMVAKDSVYHFVGQPGAPITGVVVQNVTFAAGAMEPQWLCAHVVGTAKDATPNPPCPAIKQLH